MPIQKTNLQEILDKTSYLFRTQGYHNTSISNIAKYCNLSKASVYHYMPSKEALGIAVIENSHKKFKDNVLSHAKHADQSVQQRLTNLFQATEEYFLGRDGGSLFGNLALEVTGVVTEFETLIKNFFSEWIDTIRQLLTTLCSEDKAEMMAQQIVAQTQGTIMMQSLYRDDSRLKQLTQDLIQRIKALAS